MYIALIVPVNRDDGQWNRFLSRVLWRLPWSWAPVLGRGDPDFSYFRWLPSGKISL